MNPYLYAYGNALMYNDPYGLFVPPSLPQGVVDMAVGFGDGVSFGLTRYIRDEYMDTEGTVNVCSNIYRGFEFVGSVWAPTGRFAYIFRVKQIRNRPINSSIDAVAATLERNRVKRYFRGRPVHRFINDYKSPSWAINRYNNNPSHFIYRAGSSNMYFNSLAVTGFVKAIADSAGECGCE